MSNPQPHHQSDQTAVKDFQEKLQILQEITFELSRVKTLDELYRQAILLGQSRLGFERLAILLYEVETDTVRGTYGTDETGELSDEREMQVTDIGPGFMEILTQKKRLGFWADVPLHTKGREVGSGWNAVGVLWDGDKGIGWLSTDNLLTGKPAAPHQLDLLTLYGTTLGNLIVRKQLDVKNQQSLERRSRQVKISTQVAQAIAAATNLEELYQRVVTEVKEQFGYYHAQLLRYNPQTKEMRLIAGYGEIGQKMLAQEHKIPIGNGLIGMAATTRRAILRPTITEDPDWQPNPLLPHTQGELAVPILLGEEVLGVLDIQSDKAGELNTDDQLLLVGLCGQIAIAINNTRLTADLQETTTFLETILENLPVVFFVKEATDLRFVRLNETGATLLGYDKEAFIGKSDYDFFSPEQADYFTAKDREAFATNQVLDIPEETVETRHQGTRILHTRKVPIFDGDGQPKYLLGLSMDITDQKQAEQKIWQQQKLMSLIIESAPIGLFAKDAKNDYQISIWNKVMEDIFQVKREDVLGKTDCDFTEDAALAQSYYEFDLSVMAGREIVDIPQEKILTTSGKQIWAHTVKVPIYDSEGKPDLLIGYLEDITQRKEAADAMRASEAKYRTILENIHDGYYEVNLEGTLTFVNDSLCRILGYPKEELIGMSYRDYTSEPVANYIYETYNKVFRTGAPIHSFEYEILQKTGTKKTILSSVAPIKDAEDEVIGFRGVIQDFTERKQSEKALANALAETESQAHRLSLLNELSSVFNAATNIKDVYKVVGNYVLRIIQGNWISVALLNPGKSTFEIFTLSDNEDILPTGSRLPVENTLMHLAIEKNTLLSIPSASLSDEGFVDVQQLREAGLKSFLCAPLVASGQIIGTLNVGSEYADTYKHTDINFTRQIVTLIASTIESKRSGERAQLLASIVENHPDFIGVGTLAGEAIYVNPAGLQMMDLPPSYDVNQMTTEHFYRAEDVRKLSEEGIPTALETGSWAGEAYLLKADGTTVPVEETVGINYDAEGNPISFSITMRDITERQETARVLQLQKTLLEEQAEASPDGILLVSETKEVLSFNERFIELWRLSPDVLQASSTRVYLDEVTAQVVDPEAFSAQTDEIYAHPHRKSHDELLLKDGRIFDRYSSPIENPDGGYYGRVWYIRDITSLKVAERTMRKRAEELDKLQRLLIHEKWETFLTAKERAVHGYLFNQHTIQPIIHATPSSYQEPSPLEEPTITADEIRKSGDVYTADMKIRETTIGKLGVRLTDTHLSAENRVLLDAISQQVAEALERARLFEETEQARDETEQQANRLAQLNELAAAINTADSINNIYEIVAQKIHEIAGSQHANLALLDDNTQTLEILSLDDKSGPISWRSKVPVTKTVLAKILSDNQLLYTPDIETSELFEHQEMAKEGIRSTISVPLPTSTGVIGALNVGSTDPNAFNSNDRNIIQQMASLIATNLDSQRLFAETQDRAAELAVINQVAQAVSQQLDPNQLLRTVYQQVQRIMVTDAFIVALYNAKDNMVTYPLLYDDGQYHQEAPQPLLPGSLMYQVIQTGEPLFRHNVSQSTNAEAADVEELTIGTPKLPDSLIYVPLRQSNQIVGALSVQSYKPNTYKQTDITVLNGIANHVVVALENARLFTQTEQRASELATINAVNELASSELNLVSLLEAVAPHLQTTFKASGVYVALYNKYSHTITYPYYYDITDKKRVEESERSQEFTTKIIQTGKPLLYEDFTIHQEETEGTIPGSYLGVPMIVGDETIGVIGLTNYHKTRIYHEEDQHLLMTLARTIAVAVQNARQFESAKRRAERERLVNNITQKIQSTASLERALETAVTELGQALQARSTTIALKAEKEHSDKPNMKLSDPTTSG